MIFFIWRCVTSLTLTQCPKKFLFRSRLVLTAVSTANFQEFSLLLIKSLSCFCFNGYDKSRYFTDCCWGTQCTVSESFSSSVIPYGGKEHHSIFSWVRAVLLTITPYKCLRWLEESKIYKKTLKNYDSVKHYVHKCRLTFFF